MIKPERLRKETIIKTMPSIRASVTLRSTSVAVLAN